jgi:hypothetical protein
LGFDVRRFEEALDAQLLGDGTFELIQRRRPSMGFGRLYLLRRKS